MVISPVSFELVIFLALNLFHSFNEQLIFRSYLAVPSRLSSVSAIVMFLRSEKLMLPVPEKLRRGAFKFMIAPFPFILLAPNVADTCLNTTEEEDARCLSPFEKEPVR